MKTAEREAEILRCLELHEFMSTENAMALFHVSPATARRDFNHLAEGHVVRRVRGGVRRIPAEVGQSIPFSLREQWFAREKARLAEKAMEFIAPGSVTFLHGGSTTNSMANLWKDGCVITDSIGFCELLGRRFPGGEGGPQVILAGGALDLKAGVVMGSRTERILNQYHADAVVFSARGLDEEGCLDTNDDTAGCIRAMIDHASLVILLADRSKFGSPAMARVVSWNRIDILIAAATPENREELRRIARLGVRVVPIGG